MSERGPKTTPVLDWHGVWPGYASYDEEGNYFPQDMPRGIRLSVQEAVLTEPVFQLEQRWERSSVHYPAIIREPDRFRLWYLAYPDVDDPWVKAGNIPGKYPILWCYAESSDGYHWERPELGIYSFDGSTANNIMMACGKVGAMGYMHLMRNPKGPDEERYIAVGIEGEFKIDGRPATQKEYLDLTHKLQAAGDAGSIGERVDRQVVVKAGISPDGLHWTHLEEPILRTPYLLDTQNILAYDDSIGKYVIYLRSGRARRRAVARYEAESFRGPWANHLVVLTAEPDDPPDWSIYAPAYCRHPRGGHLMFFSPFRQAGDLLDVYLAVSHDGQLWARPERKPIIPLTDRYGGLYPTPELVELDRDTWGVMTMGCQHAHNYLAASAEDTLRLMKKHPSEFVWATWKRDRLVAIEADDYAEFTMSELECCGGQLQVNFKTHQPGAHIKVEIVDGGIPNRSSAENPPALAGFAFDNCDALSGDNLDGVVSWGGTSDLSALKGKNIHLRFRMARAKLFAVTL